MNPWGSDLATAQRLHQLLQKRLHFEGKKDLNDRRTGPLQQESQVGEHNHRPQRNSKEKKTELSRIQKILIATKGPRTCSFSPRVWRHRLLILRLSNLKGWMQQDIVDSMVSYGYRNILKFMTLTGRYLQSTESMHSSYIFKLSQANHGPTVLWAGPDRKDIGSNISSVGHLQASKDSICWFLGYIHVTRRKDCLALIGFLHFLILLHSTEKG